MGRPDVRWSGGQALEALQDPDALVHLANLPAPGLAPPATTFTANVTTNFNVFHAAARLGVRRGRVGASETTLGLPFDEPPRDVLGYRPRYSWRGA